MILKNIVVGILCLSLWAGFSSPSFAITRERAVKRVMDAGQDAIGTPYSYGSSSLSGFDCSGLTMWSWKRGHINLPHSASEQYQTIHRHVHRRNLQRGDLLFFYRPISHVGLYIGHGRMIAASTSGTRVGRQDVYWGSFVGGARPLKRAWT